MNLQIILKVNPKQCCCVQKEDTSEAIEEDPDLKSQSNDSDIEGSLAQSQQNRENELNPILELTVIESDSFEAKRVFHVSPSGLLELTSDQSIQESQFSLRFDSSTYKYSIVDTGFGSGTFVRLKTQFVLTDNSIVSFGENHLLIKVKEDFLSLFFIEGSKKGQKFKIDKNKKAIIGRTKDCFIRFHDQNLSRHHCSIAYLDQWVLFDGTGDKPSLNGTWVFAKEEIEVYEGLEFNSGSHYFKVNIV